MRCFRNICFVILLNSAMIHAEDACRDVPTPDEFSCEQQKVRMGDIESCPEAAFELQYENEILCYRQLNF